MKGKKTVLTFLRRLIFLLLPIALGMGGFFYMSSVKKPPRQKKTLESAPVVRVMKITPLDVMPRAYGYGTAKPVRVWKAIAQVSGKIVYTHPQLQKGKGVREGTLLLQIDPAEYKITISQLQTKIKSYLMQIRELDAQQENNRELLKIQQQTLKIKKRELERQKTLYDRKMISANEYEAQLQAMMAQQVQVQSIQNSLNLIPYQKDQFNAQIEQARGDLENARLQLSYTEIRAPFNAQVASVNHKTPEFVQRGQTILEANDISAMEIEAQFIPGSARPVFYSFRDRLSRMDMETPSIGKELGVSAVVRIPGDTTGHLSWPAELNRFSDAVDSETRTMGLIFVVRNALDIDPEKQRRPLFSGTYCEVELRGRMIGRALVIPRSALHPGNTVYLMTPEKTLEKRTVQPGPPLESFLLIRKGVKDGETLILSDVIPAVEGMKVRPVNDREALKQLKRDAQGGRE